MAHFAELDEDNIVQRVIVVSNKNTSDGNGVESEDIGISFCKTLYGSDTNWKQCSYSMRIRRAFPSAGMLYNETHDMFHYMSPFPSWTLNSNAIWEAPNDEPSITEEQRSLGYEYRWSETEYQRDSSTGWILFTPQLITINTQPSPTTVSVSVGSSVNISAAATISKDNMEASIQKLTVNDDGVENWSYLTDPTRSEDLSLSVTLNTGILTDTSNSGGYRIAFVPLESGVIGYTTSVTITVTD
jgi:hypothetical protein